MLRESVMRNEIELGSFIDEQNLANQFSVGRTPMREAIKRLSTEGILEIIPRKGILVKPVTTQYLKDILEARSYLEPYVAELAAKRIKQEEIDNLWAMYNEYEVYVEEGDQWKLSSIDRELHVAVARASKNQVLIDLIEKLSSNMQRIWMYMYNLNPYQEKYIAMPSQWKEIIHNISNNNASAAKESIYSHITYGQKNIL